MFKLTLASSLLVFIALQNTSSARSFDAEKLFVTVTDITEFSALAMPTPPKESLTAVPSPTPDASTGTSTIPSTTPSTAASTTTGGDNTATTTSGGVTSTTTTVAGHPATTTSGAIDPGASVGNVYVDKFILLGTKIWNFVLENKPTATYDKLNASVVPSGIASWAQLSGWTKPVTKVFHVDFKNLLGRSAGGFDYQITFIYGGSYQGKGKYIGQISFMPKNIKLHTDRSVTIHAEILNAINFGTEENPIAGVQLAVSWNSPTTLRYEMNSQQYFLYGTGEIQDMNGNLL